MPDDKVRGMPGEPLPCCCCWRVCMSLLEPPLVVVKDESAVKLLYMELLLPLLPEA